MREVSIRELKDRASEWVRLVEEGERVVITRSGRRVAVLAPLADLPLTRPEEILADLAARGAVRLPQAGRAPDAFAGPTVPARGASASDMVLEDRR